MSDRPHKKRALSLHHNKVRGSSFKSRAKHDITISDLTDMFIPLYKYTFKGYGVNNVFYHTLKDMNLMSLQSGLDSRGGDLSVISCLPGRQAYCEFNALPLLNINSMTAHAGLSYNANGYSGYARSLSELVERALMHNNFYPQNGNSPDYYQTLNSAHAMSVGFFKTLFGASNFNIWANDNAAYLTMTKLQDIHILYEGGCQRHKFTNTTSLPIYLEFRECMPKQVMGPGAVYGNWSYVSNGVMTSAGGIAIRPALVCETFYADLQRQRARANGLDVTNLYPEQNTLFNDVDDKEFKYNKYMKMTNNRFVVGDAVRVRVDPGNTYTHVMELPAFKLSTAELYEFNHFYYSTSGQRAEQGPTGSSSANDPTFLNYFPKFSKFLTVRATGSSSFTQGPVGASVGEIKQLDGMSDPIGTDVTNFLTGDANQQINTHAVQGTRTATHAVQLTHEMSEEHYIRVKPVCPGFHMESANWMPNSRDKTNIVKEDDMGFLDPTSNSVDAVAGDME